MNKHKNFLLCTPPSLSAACVFALLFTVHHACKIAIKIFSLFCVVLCTLLFTISPTLSLFHLAWLPSHQIYFQRTTLSTLMIFLLFSWYFIYTLKYRKSIHTKFYCITCYCYTMIQSNFKWVLRRIWKNFNDINFFKFQIFKNRWKLNQTK